MAWITVVTLNRSGWIDSKICVYVCIEIIITNIHKGEFVEIGEEHSRSLPRNFS